jgi:thioredoxin reductase
LLCDDQRPRNKPSSHLNNFPTRDGIHPAQWREAAKADVVKYGTTEFFDGHVKSIKKMSEGFETQLSSGTSARVRKVVLADGIQDRLPDLPGVKELWGKSIFHCPFCHGYEVAGQRLALVANGEFAEHMLPMIWGLSQDLILITNGRAELHEEFRDVLMKKNLLVIESKLKALLHDKEKMTALEFEDGSRIERNGMFMAPQLPFQLKSSLADQLGCLKTELGLIKVNERGQTSVPGVLAAGDNTSMMQSVLMASAAGSMAGAAAIGELLAEDIRK